VNQIARQLHWPAPRWIEAAALEPSQLPCLVHHPVHGWGVVHSFNAQQQWILEIWETTAQAWTEHAQAQLQGAALAKVQCTAPWQLGRSRIWHQILTEFAQEKSTLLQAALTGAMINLVALASSLYSMQVYDRVVPTGASQTLWVLTLGVIAATAFELLAKWTRSSLYDHVIDLVVWTRCPPAWAHWLASCAATKPCANSSAASSPTPWWTHLLPCCSPPAWWPLAAGWPSFRCAF
jgi:ATP-binding cassette subfamily C protein LapB